MPRVVLFSLSSLVLGLAVLAARADLDIYTDSLQNGWENWSWATVNLASATPTPHSGSACISVVASNTASNWRALYLHTPALAAAAYTNLTFWIHGGTSGGQSIQVQAMLGGTPQANVVLPNLAAGVWQQYSLPLTSLGLSNQVNFDGFWLQARGNATVPVFYVDDLKLISAPTGPPPSTNASVAVLVDAAADLWPISPMIYGVAFAGSNQLKELNAPANRWGGNSTTRYNWQVNGDNRAADWYFQSLPSSTNSTPGAEADLFIADSRNGAATPLLTIPIIGWVAKLGPGRARLCSYSISKYGAQTGNDAQWFPDAGNGIAKSNTNNITWNDPTDANVAVGTNFMAGWIRSLTNRWGAAAFGGLRHYVMDNEWSLWHETHRDVHPVGATMDECRDKFLDMALLIKGIDPAALIVGPEEWGWLGYLNSGYDLQNAGGADRAAHGGKDFSPWFLEQARLRSEAAGKRLLDCFTLHYYPQGGEFGSEVTTAMQLRRNRSTRSLWDTNYTDETWIAQKIQLIPRMKQWVAANYPGTPIGITEYSFGAESHINGATTQADILGILGREQVDLATRWTVPPTGSAVYKAFQMYRNYDGSKSTFGQVNVRTRGPNPDVLVAFSALRTNDGALTVMVINKSLTNATPFTMTLTNFNPAGPVQWWRLDSANAITRLADLAVSGKTLSNTVPAQSLNLFILPTVPQARLTATRGSDTAPLTLILAGTLGTTWILQQSPNLANWTPVSTNTLTSTSPLTLTLPPGVVPQRFYRAQAR